MLKSVIELSPAARSLSNASQGIESAKKQVKTLWPNRHSRSSDVLRAVQRIRYWRSVEELLQPSQVWQKGNFEVITGTPKRNPD